MDILRPLTTVLSSGHPAENATSGENLSSFSIPHQVSFDKLMLAQYLSLFALSVILVSHIKFELQQAVVKVPFGLRYLSVIPRFFSNILYGINAKAIIMDTYMKHRDRPFNLVRNDVDMCILPLHAVEELSSLPLETASGIRALEHDLLGKWTGLSIILESRLHHRVVLRKVTPGLTSIIPAIEDEISASIADHFPSNTEDWISFNPYYTLLKVTSRISSRALIGFPICRDPKWLKVSMDFTENIFQSIVIMRFFPPWMYGFLGMVLPSCWRSKAHIASAKELLRPAFEKRLQDMKDGSYDPNLLSSIGGFDWLSEIAEGNERDANKLAHYEILLALASIHTTLLRLLNVIYDLMESPSCLEEVLAEIADERKKGWNKMSYHALIKLDSVLRESQRMTPPQIIGLRRIMQADYTMHDGTFLPKGSYVCVPTYCIENDPDLVTDPGKFDGLRNSRLRVRPDQSVSTRHQFTTAEETVLGFGHGRTACPGRFFASLSLKATLVKLLTEYEFQFKPENGQTSRPENLYVHEFVFPRRGAEILIRKKIVS